MLALAVASAPALGEKRGKGSGGWRGADSAGRAADEARRRYGGRVLDVRPASPDGSRDGYRVRLLDRGEVRSVTIPESPGKGGGRARSGR